MAKKTDSSIPPGNPADQIAWFSKQLEKKADEKWTESGLKTLEKSVDEAKKIAISARDKSMKSHGCVQDDKIGEIMKTIDGWKTVRLGVVISVVVLIAAGLAQFFALKAKADDTEQVVTEVQSSVNEIKKDVNKVTIAVDDHLEWTEEHENNKDVIDQKQLKAISETVKIAVEEAQKKKKR